MNDTANVWNNTRPMREVRYLMQSSVPSWPGYMNRFLSGPGIASLVNTTSNGPALLFHARHPNNQGARYLWKFSYLSLKPGVWDLDSGSLAELITLGGACAPPYNGSLSRCKFMNESVDATWSHPLRSSLGLKTEDYAADGENFECRRSFGVAPAEYPLPCRALADDYTSRASREFVITAWWAPLVASSDAHGSADQLQEYIAAGFNAVRTSNVAGFCQYDSLYN